MPAAVPLTFTENVHEPLPASEPPERLMTFVFCVAEIVPVPQLPVKPLGVEIIKPGGSVLLNPTPVSAVEFGLLSMNVSEVEPLSGMLAAPNASAMAGAPIKLAITLFGAFIVIVVLAEVGLATPPLQLPNLKNEFGVAVMGTVVPES